MRSRAAATAFALLSLTSGALAQTAQPTMPHRQPRAGTAPAPAPAAKPDAGPSDMEATRKRFEANAAKQTEADRKRDAKLNHSMRSICGGCDAPSANRPRP